MLQHHEHSRVLDLYHELSKMCREVYPHHSQVLMEKMMRAFIAIPLNSAIHKELASFAAGYKLSRENGFRPVNPEIIHLTLKFLGESSQEKLRRISSGLEGIVQAVHPFPLLVEAVGAFPNWDRARVVWVGVKAPQALQSLFAQIDQVTAELGFPSEGRHFTPHLTLARLITSPPIPAAAEILKNLRTLSPAPQFGSMQADEVILFQSTLTPQGPIYTHLSRHAFQA